MATVAIVGAGVAGLSAGGALARAGHLVTVFEKSRGLGGRVTTRRAPGGFAIDHGAQLMKAPSLALRALVAAVPDATTIEPPVWTFDGAGRLAPGDPTLNAEPSWTWPGGIAALARHLGHGLDVRREVTVAGLAGEPGAYRVRGEAGEHGPFDAVLLTAPAPQTAAILAASAIDAATRDALQEALAPVRYRPCLSVALAYARRPELPWYAAVNTDRAHPVAWLACEHVKPERAPAGAGLLLAQMGPSWTERRWDGLPKGFYPGDALPAAAAEVHTIVQGLVGAELGAPLWADAHRWRYALCDAPCGPAALAGVAGIFVAGDLAVGRGRVHLAIESGWAAAEQIAVAQG
jgi:predicted NAD/FAD-dependent oxidoreductase